MKPEFEKGSFLWCIWYLEVWKFGGLEVFGGGLMRGRETPVRFTTGQAFAWRVVQGKDCGGDLLCGLFFRTHSRPFPTKGREKWMCLFIRKSYNRFILFSTGMVFLVIKSGGLFVHSDIGSGS